MPKYTSACNSLRPGQLDRLANKITASKPKIAIKDVDREKFKLDRNKWLDECYQTMKNLEFKTNHASDDTTRQNHVFFLNQIYHTIELLKRCDTGF